MKSQQFDILAVGAHPDDVDFCMGGILAKMSAEGSKVAILDLTSGEKGTHGTPTVRRKEGEKAAIVIGAKRFFLDFKDGSITDTPEGRKKIARVIRQLKPKLVFAPLWKGEMSHPDHFGCGELSRHAVRYARLEKMVPRVKKHQVDGILHYLFPYQENPDFLVDITPYADVWKEMMMCHESQMKTFDYAGWNMRSARKFGDMAGVVYAQGLIKGNPIIVETPLVISRGIREV